VISEKEKTQEFYYEIESAHTKTSAPKIYLIVETIKDAGAILSTKFCRYRLQIFYMQTFLYCKEILRNKINNLNNLNLTTYFFKLKYGNYQIKH